MNSVLKVWVASAVVCAAVVLQSPEVDAAYVYSGRDSVSEIAKHMGYDPSKVVELAKITKKKLSKGGFSVSVSEKSGRKPISGKWDFDGLVKDASIVLAVSTSNGKGKPKPGHGWVMTSFGVGVTQGTWGVEPIWDEFGKKKTMHHVTAYKVMMDPVKVVTNPIPGAVWLFGTALAALGLLTRRRIAA